MRNQTGRVFVRGDAFYVQYRTTIVAEDGKPQRVQRAQKLLTDPVTGLFSKDGEPCMKGKKGDYKYEAKRKKVKGKSKIYLSTELQKVVKSFMSNHVNANQPGASSLQPNMTVVEFWQSRFLPHCEETIQVGERAGEQRNRPATIRGFKQIWRQHLQPHFANMTLREYEPRFGNRFLESLTATQNKNTLKHIKALATAIFGYAVRQEIIAVNPWHDVSIPEDAITPKRTAHYTLKEAQALISALVEHVDCQLILALSCFLGLRPGEIAALRWEDFDLDSGTVHICRSVVRGIVDVPKTPESTAEIPLIAPVLIPLKLWHDKRAELKDAAGSTTGPATLDGYVFESRNGTPLDLHNVVSRIIIPHVNGGRRCVACDATPSPSSVTWKGLYAGRRGACTITIDATDGDASVAQALLRHKSMKTTLDVYKKPIRAEKFAAGMKLLEAKAAETAKAAASGN
jgi:integrase